MKGYKRDFVVKSLFGLMRRSLFNTVHHMTDQDSSLGPSFIVSRIRESDEILSKQSLQKHFPLKSRAETFLV
jgi:hypothetical protein